MLPFDLDSNFATHILALLKSLQTNVLPALFDLLVGIIVIRLLVRLTRFLLKLSHVQTGLRYVVTSIVQVFLWIFLTITILDQLGFGQLLIPFAGSLALIGIVMAAGGSTLLSDIIAAIFLAQDGDFNVGDEMMVGWDPAAGKGTQGVIERMDARRIRVRDADGVLHVIPNSFVERKEWMVLNRRAELSATARAVNSAKKLRAVALEKRTKIASKSKESRKNNQ